jgi:hypothetical protein
VAVGPVQPATAGGGRRGHGCGGGAVHPRQGCGRTRAPGGAGQPLRSAVTAAVEEPCLAVRVGGEIMGSQKCRIVGNSQSLLIMINPNRSLTPVSGAGRALARAHARPVRGAAGLQPELHERPGADGPRLGRLAPRSRDVGHAEAMGQLRCAAMVSGRACWL